MRLSNKHGVNPSVCRCWYCGEESGALILAGMIKGDEKMPMSGVFDMEPCDKCKGYMERGIILLGVKDDAELDKMEAARKDWLQKYGHLSNEKKPYPGHFVPNPHRSGGWWLVSEDYIRRVFDRGADRVCEHRFAFIAQEAADTLGLTDAVPDESES
jgi:hypothetical protein